MTTPKIRWGILSTAQIARKNWLAILLSGNGVVTAVASRDAGRAGQFVAECQGQHPMPAAPRVLGSYEELIASPDVDALYIPLPTGSRKEWVIRAAQAGKHVVCEKPCAVSLADLREMTEACRRHNVQFMDGVMFMHGRRLARMRELLDQEATLGQLRRITSAFSFCAPDSFFEGNIRSNSALEPFGCLGDLGWYNIRFSLWAMREQLPLRVRGRLHRSVPGLPGHGPVPTEFSAELVFEGGVSSAFYCSFVTGDEQWAHISGTTGLLRVSDFVLPFFGNETRFRINQSSLEKDGCDFHMEARERDSAVAEYSDSHATAQETALFRNFAAQVLSGTLNDHWPRIALNTQQVMEACLASAVNDGRVVELG